MTAQRFKANIYKIGINPVVDPPDKILRAIFTQAGKNKGPIPVRGRLNGAGPGELIAFELIKAHGEYI